MIENEKFAELDFGVEISPESVVTIFFNNILLIVTVH